jgi:hypothetical protein
MVTGPSGYQNEIPASMESLSILYEFKRKRYFIFRENPSNEN